MNIRISAIDFFLPEKRLSNTTLAEKYGFDFQFLSEKLGIEERGRIAEYESCHSMAHEAAIRLIRNTGISENEIGLLIVVTQNPDYKIPNVAPLLQASLGIGNGVAAFDMNMGCSGFVYALAVAKGMLPMLNGKKAVIVTSDPYSRVILAKDRNTAPIFGDAAAAVLVEPSETNGVGAFDFGTDGKKAETLIVKTGGSRYPYPSENEADNYLYMDGRAIFNFILRRAPKSIASCLLKNDLTIDDIDFFVFHQASRYLLSALSKRIGIPEEKVVIKLADCGNTVSSSIPIALKNLLHDHANTDKKVVLSGFGVGLSWASTMIVL